ncbi:MAG: hypothetical protein M1377_00640 [Deltaproteobacteria bacterium]|nr:hypothetical protein [Deltaproteobacteria bacterium]
MPKIPRYTRQVEAAAIPVPEGAPQATALPPEAFGAGLAKGMDVVSKVLKEEKDYADRSAYQDARTETDGKINDLLSHPETGALTTKGKNAFGIDQPTLEAFDQLAQEKENSLGNDAQKNAFRSFIKERRVDVEKQIQRHINQELDAYDAETSKASIETTTNNVWLHYQDPDRVEREHKFGVATILSERSTRGASPESTKSRIDAWNSIVYSTVVTRMMTEGAAAQAKTYFESVKDRITAADQEKLGKALKPMASAQIGLDTALNVFRTDPTKSVDLMMNEVRGRLRQDPDSLKHAETELKAMVTERETGRKQRVEDLTRKAAGPLAQAVLAGKPISMAMVPPDVMSAMFLEDPTAALKFQDDVNKRADAEEKDEGKKAFRTVMDDIVRVEQVGKIARISDIGPGKLDALRAADPYLADKVLDELRQEGEHASDRIRILADRPTTQQTHAWSELKLNPDLLRSKNLLTLVVRGDLTNSQFKDLIEEQQALLKDKTGEREGALRTTKDIVDGILKPAGITEEGNQETYDKFHEQLQIRRKGFMAEHQGKQPPQEQTREMARELLVKLPGEVFGGGFFGKRSFQVPDEKILVPEGERVKIEAALRRAGHKVDDAAVADLYRRNLEQKGMNKR